MWMFPKIMVPPKSSILIAFSIINYPFWGTPIFGNTHVHSELCRLEKTNKTVGQAIPWSYSLHGFYICTWHHIRLSSARFCFFEKKHHQRWSGMFCLVGGGFTDCTMVNHKPNTILELFPSIKQADPRNLEHYHLSRKDVLLATWLWSEFAPNDLKAEGPRDGLIQHTLKIAKFNVCSRHFLNIIKVCKECESVLKVVVSNMLIVFIPNWGMCSTLTNKK